MLLERMDDYVPGIVHCTALLFALCTSAVLLHLLCTSKSANIETYARILRYQCVVDLLAVVCNVAAHPVHCYVAEQEMVMLRGWLLWGSGPEMTVKPAILYALYCATRSSSMLISCVDFYYRYQLVCRYRQMSATQLQCFVSIVYAICLVDGLLAVRAALSTKQNHLGQWNEMVRHSRPFQHPDGSLPVLIFLGAEPETVQLLIYVLTEFVGAFTLSAVLYLKVHRHLKCKSAVMSKRTKSLNDAVNQIMVVQLVSPLVANFLPTLMGVTMNIMSIPPSHTFMQVYNNIDPFIPTITTCAALVIIPRFRRRIVGFLKGSEVSPSSVLSTIRVTEVS